MRRNNAQALKGEFMGNHELGYAAVLGSLLLATGLILAQPLSGQEVQRLSGARVAIYNLAGQVDVVAGSGPDVVVEITRGGQDAEALEVEVSAVAGREALRIVYPGDQVVYSQMGRGSNTTVRVREDGTFFNDRGGERVRISGRGSGLEAHADLRITVPAGTDIAVYQAVGEGRVEGLEADVLFETGSGNVDVSHVVGAVNVDTGSGAVHIRDVEGNVSADTGSGSIDLERIQAERVVADTGSGYVEGTALNVDALSVDTGSGHIRMESLSASEISCDTGSGSVRLDLLTDVDHVDVDTGSGSVHLTVPEAFGAEIELDSGSGGIDVDVPVTVAEAKRDYFRGSIGDGVGRVVVETGSGGIEIRSR